MKITSLGIAGAGQMGSGIAQTAACRGLTVVIYDIAEKSIQHALETINRSLNREIEKGRIGEPDRNSVLSRICAGAGLKDLAVTDFIIEAAPEREDIKSRIFKELDSLCPPSMILATNTSSISIGRIAAYTRHPERVIGMHFMNPAPVMKLVEVIRSTNTSEEAFRTTWELAERLEKVPVEANDYPGFITNRILMTMINEAVFTLYHGVGTREAIDASMCLGMNHPMGPLALADHIGLDTCLAIMETLQDGFKDSRYSPCPLLRQYVEAGRLGKKSGEGFYQYNGSSEKSAGGFLGAPASRRHLNRRR